MPLTPIPLQALLNTVQSGVKSMDQPLPQQNLTEGLRAAFSAGRPPTLDEIRQGAFDSASFVGKAVADPTFLPDLMQKAAYNAGEIGFKGFWNAARTYVTQRPATSIGLALGTLAGMAMPGGEHPNPRALAEFKLFHFNEAIAKPVGAVSAELANEAWSRLPRDIQSLIGLGENAKLGAKVVQMTDDELHNAAEVLATVHSRQLALGNEAAAKEFGGALQQVTDEFRARQIAQIEGKPGPLPPIKTKAVEHPVVTGPSLDDLTNLYLRSKEQSGGNQLVSSFEDLLTNFENPKYNGGRAARDAAEARIQQYFSKPYELIKEKDIAKVLASLPPEQRNQLLRDMAIQHGGSLEELHRLAKPYDTGITVQHLSPVDLERINVRGENARAMEGQTGPLPPIKVHGPGGEGLLGPLPETTVKDVGGRPADAIDTRIMYKTVEAQQDYAVDNPVVGFGKPIDHPEDFQRLMQSMGWPEAQARGLTYRALAPKVLKGYATPREVVWFNLETIRQSWNKKP